MKTTRRKSTTRQKWLLTAGSTVAALLLLGLVELVLAAFDVGALDVDDDPFFDFEAVTGLFEPTETAAGRVLRTRESKRAIFNQQQFPATKGESTFRVFALGGSTTYGRPYDWQVAFPHWLERLLDAADTNRGVEVINAGGVSYASYRVRVLMEELVDYEPDLFVVYTGQNEFLEERVYGDRLRENAVLKLARRQLGGLRTVRWLRGLLAGDRGDKQRVTEEVQTRLDVWEGLQSFTRDDALRDDVVTHYEWNVTAMIRLARERNVPIVFAVPASNESGFSPFKSAHTPDRTPEQRATCEAALADGRRALAEQRPEDAVAAFARGLAIDDRHAELHYRSGLAHAALGEHAAAESAFRRALEEDVCPLRAIPALGAALRRVTGGPDGVPLVDLPTMLAEQRRAAGQHAAPGNEEFLDHVHPRMAVHQRLAEAIATVVAERGWLPGARLPDAEERARIYADVVDGLDAEYYARRDLNLAKVLSWSGKYEEATEALLRSRELLQDDPEMHYNLGILMRRQGRFDEALAAYQQAVTLAPTHFLAQFGVAKSLQQLARDGEACAAFRRALELTPDHTESCYNLAFSAWRAGRADDALRALDRLASLDPAYPKQDLLRGRVLMDLGRTDEAAALLGTAGSAEAHYYAGLAHSRAGRFADAEAALRQALAQQPEFVPALRELAQVYQSTNRADRAVVTYGQAIALAHDDAQLHFELGVLHYDGQRLDEAAKCYLQAIERDPDHAPAHTNLGAILLQRRDLGGALRAFTRAVELDPDDGPAHYSLAQLRLAAGDKTGARQHLDRAVALGITPSQKLIDALGQ